jgi:hypothetical protein
VEQSAGTTAASADQTAASPSRWLCGWRYPTLLALCLVLLNVATLLYRMYLPAIYPGESLRTILLEDTIDFVGSFAVYQLVAYALGIVVLLVTKGKITYRIVGIHLLYQAALLSAGVVAAQATYGLHRLSLLNAVDIWTILGAAPILALAGQPICFLAAVWVLIAASVTPLPATLLYFARRRNVINRPIALVSALQVILVAIVGHWGLVNTIHG